MDTLSLRLLTWNVNEKYPSETDTFADLVGVSNEDVSSYPDLIVTGFQEVNAMPQNYLFDSMVVGEDPWTRRVKQTLSSHGYVKVNGIRLVGMVISLFALRKHLLHIRGIESQYTKIAFGGFWGSKGGVSVRIGVYGTSFSFVNTHLPAHDHANQMRIDGYSNIIEYHKYLNKDTNNILYHDYIFWIGDLNFRIIENSFDFREIVMLANQREFDVLIRHDQLTETIDKGLAFSELKEGIKPKFPPTYKFKVGTSEYDPKRRPAYTDRILHRVNTYNYENAELKAEQESYTSYPRYENSDHKPVTADFKISVFNSQSALDRDIRQYDPSITFETPERWLIGEDGRISYYINQGQGGPLNSWDWIALYKSNFDSLDDYLTFTWASTCKLTGIAKEAWILDSALHTPGDYILIYFGSDKSILGMSQPFPLVYSKDENTIIRAESIDVGTEAHETRSSSSCSSSSSSSIHGNSRFYDQNDEECKLLND